MKLIISVIEFRQRGLPHVHILSILDRVDSILAEEINNHSVAEIPNKNESPKDWKNVASFMLHKPCGSVNSDASCCQQKSTNAITTFFVSTVMYLHIQNLMVLQYIGGEHRLKGA